MATTLFARRDHGWVSQGQQFSAVEAVWVRMSRRRQPGSTTQSHRAKRLQNGAKGRLYVSNYIQDTTKVWLRLLIVIPDCSKASCCGVD